MRDSVYAAWPEFIAGWEGRTNFMYLDTLKLVTFGVGRKIDDGGRITGYGLTRPWRDRAENLVLESRIATEWSAIKARTDLASQGGYAFAAVATLHLADADVDEALRDTTDGFWDILVRQLPKLPQWPADAQLALANMAYHMGPYFLGSTWPNFTAAANREDFAGCADHCSTSRRTGRDAANRRLFTNAAVSGWAGLDPEVLFNTAPVTVQIGGSQYTALGAVAAVAVIQAEPDEFNLDAWYVQRMLYTVGAYLARLDGLWGPRSRAAYAAWAKSALQPATVSADGLKLLSRVTLGMPVS